jgi:hypothetical protein
VEEVNIPVQSAMKEALTIQAILRDAVLNAEANRIADLIFLRVDASGSKQIGIAPLRTAPTPTQLLLVVAEILRQQPLICALCGSPMQLRPKNKLLQVSPDRIDSKSGSYGPENFQLAHLGCNLAKNNVTEEQFREWLRTASESLLDSSCAE